MKAEYEAIVMMLVMDEGLVLKPYQDHLGNWTIGVGHLLSNGITEQTAMYILEEDIQDTLSSLYRVFGDLFDTFSERQQLALINMMFNLGQARFEGFKKMIAAIKQDNWREASAQCLDSKAARQLPQRYARIARDLEL